jgi:hypothetical protein
VRKVAIYRLGRFLRKRYKDILRVRAELTVSETFCCSGRGLSTATRFCYPEESVIRTGGEIVFLRAKVKETAERKVRSKKLEPVACGCSEESK